MIAKFPQPKMKKTENKISEKPESKREERERERRKTGRAEARSGPTETFVKKSFLSHFRYAHFFLVSWYLLGSGLARGRQWQRQWEGPKKMPAARKTFEKDSAGTKFRNCQSDVKLRTLSVLRNWKIWASSFNLVSTVTTDQSNLIKSFSSPFSFYSDFVYLFNIGSVEGHVFSF